MLDSLRVDTLRLRFSNRSHPDLVLGTGVHGVGRGEGGAIAPSGGAGEALLQFCVDRRGVWMRLAPQARGVHVNGRPVQRMAMLRVGDAIYVEGTELVLLGPRQVQAQLPAAANDGAGGDARMLLRGVGGHYHGRSFTLDKPRLVGSGPECDIRIDDPAFPERHARIEVQGGAVLLRDVSRIEGSQVNGEYMRQAVLVPGDQLVFDAHQRFVVEAPGHAHAAREAQAAAELDGWDTGAPAADGRVAAQGGHRLPWLLLAALVMAAALSALLWFGAAA